MLRRKLFRKVALIPLFFVLIAVKWSYLMPPAFPDTPTDKLMFLNLTVPFNNLLLPNVSDWSFRAVKIVAFVISMPKLAGRRRAIRNTWASRNHSKTLADGQGLVLFVLSSPKFEHERRALLQEQLLYNDLIVTDIHETYRNLVLKVYVALLFFVKHFQKAEFLLKVDDDVTVLLDTMLKHWNKNVLGSDVVYCKLWNTHGPIRNRLSKWYIPVSIWSDSLYPSYCDGPLYLLGREAANRIAQNAANFKPFPFEDVFFTGIVGSYSGTKKFNWSGELTTTEPDYLLAEEECERSSGKAVVFAVHPLSSSALLHRDFEDAQKYRCFHNQNKRYLSRIVRTLLSVFSDVLDAWSRKIWKH